MPTALVTGATGTVGSQLVSTLLDAGWGVRVLARTPSKTASQPWSKHITLVTSADDPTTSALPNAESVQVYSGDASSYDDLIHALDGVDVSYYLLHSMGNSDDFATVEAQMARTFVSAVDYCHTPRIIYLGGLHPSGAKELSPHLASRVNVGRILRTSTATTLCLQAGVVLGPGSASFIMLRHLAERLPGIIAPSWIHHKITPISSRNLMHILKEAATVEVSESRTFDIGGPNDYEYVDILRRYAKYFRMLPRPVITLPVTTLRLGAQWVGLVTPISAKLALPLVESLQHDTVVSERDLQEQIVAPEGGYDDIESAFAAAAPTIKPHRWRRVLLGTGSAVGLTAMVSSAGIATHTWWYKSLKQPAYTPPRWVFPIAWTAIYLSLWVNTALTIADLGDDADGEAQPSKLRQYVGTMSVNLALNAAWPWVFFQARKLKTGTVISAALAGSSTELVRRTAATNRVRGAALAIYPAWTTLATAISGSLARNNFPRLNIPFLRRK